VVPNIPNEDVGAFCPKVNAGEVVPNVGAGAGVLPKDGVVLPNVKVGAGVVVIPNPVDC